MAAVTAALGAARARSIPRDAFLWPSILIVLLIFVGCWIADQVGSNVLIFAVLWGPLLYRYVLAAPVHLSARVMFLLALVLEPPAEQPGYGYWTSVLAPASQIYYDALKAWAGIPGLSFSLYTLLCLVLYFRATRGRKAPGYVAPPPEAVKAVKLWLLALTLLLIWGLIRGGNGKAAFFQLQHLYTLGFCALAFLHALRGPADLRALGTIVVVAAITKGLLVGWVYYVVCAPMGLKPFYATTHSDSVTFAMCIIILATRLFEERDGRSLRLFLCIVPFIVMAIVMNNRRLAFVGVGFGVVTTYAVMKSGRLKRKIARIALALAPLVVVYVKVGGHSTNPLFAPAAMVNSALSGTDSSSITRDIENYNLIFTMNQQGRILGTGFGHEYIEAVRADDISQAFALYRYIPHNSVLWLWSFGGLIGFTALWMVYPLLAYFGARGYHGSLDPIERAAGLTTLAGAMTLMAQNWGDMGLQSYTSLTVFGICYSVAAKLCMAADSRRASAPAATASVAR